MKTSREYLSEANALVEKISTEEGIQKHRDGNSLFIDVRDSADIGKTGTIKDCLRIPRGLIEFAADEMSALYNDKLSKQKELVLICGAGGMAALSGRTLLEMGYKNIKNVGAFGDWIKAGGPTER